MIRYLTSGESHGKGYTLIIEGFPSGFTIDLNYIQQLLSKRQKGVGRSKRSLWEDNSFDILSGILEGKTTGAPLAFFIPNNFKSQKKPYLEKNLHPRPGHADHAGSIKYAHENIIPVIERASGRDTVARTLCGTLCLSFLNTFGVESLSHVINIGGICASRDANFDYIRERLQKSLLHCANTQAEQEMKGPIEKATREGTSVGGIGEVRFRGIPIGLGSYVHWDRNLDGSIAKAICSIPGIKGVQFGAGFDYANLPGHIAHDAFIQDNGFHRRSNHAGGIEGGMSNGEEIVASFVIKPPSSLLKPLSSINLSSHSLDKAFVTRSDVCFVQAVCIVAQAVTGIEILNAFLEKWGGDSHTEIKKHYEASYKHSL
ncbi:MAG: chorismate synthase [Deltaproteobacteria bacterium]|nr:chorismate synthase [Deltaproteobacteria bacterium]